MKTFTIVEIAAAVRIHGQILNFEPTFSMASFSKTERFTIDEEGYVYRADGLCIAVIVR